MSKASSTSVTDFEEMLSKVVEFKYAQSADAALRQCRERNYAARFVGENRPVFYIGVNYNPKSRTIDDVRCERAD